MTDSTPPPPGCDPESIVLTFRVAREHAGQRLDRFLQSRIPRLSRSRAQRIVRACAYRPDGGLRRPSDRVREGETVTIVRPRFDEPEAPLHFTVLHEDDLVLALSKPAGLPMHPTATYHRHTLTRLLRERYGDPPPRIAHRLDRETSGIVVCGRTLDAERQLKRTFEDRGAEKTYLAIVRGAPPRASGRIELPLASAGLGGAGSGRDPLHVLMEVSDRGTAAVTEYELRAEANGYAVVALWPRTGRQHQLRVHLAAVGCPIVGDKLYGPEGPQPFLDFIDGGMTEELQERLVHPRQALHAHELRLLHPGTGGPWHVRADLPADLQALWARLGSKC